MAIGMVRKISAHWILLVIAAQNTLSANSASKLSSPTNAGAETPSQRENDAPKVSSAGSSTMATLSSKAGVTNST